MGIIEISTNMAKYGLLFHLSLVFQWMMHWHSSFVVNLRWRDHFSFWTARNGCSFLPWVRSSWENLPHTHTGYRKQKNWSFRLTRSTPSSQIVTLDCLLISSTFLFLSANKNCKRHFVSHGTNGTITSQRSTWQKGWKVKPPGSKLHQIHL